MWRSLKSDIFPQLWIQWDRGSLFCFLQFTTKFCLHILEPRHSNITYFTFLYNFEKAQLGHVLFEKTFFKLPSLMPKIHPSRFWTVISKSQLSALYSGDVKSRQTLRIDVIRKRFRIMYAESIANISINVNLKTFLPYIN